MNAHGNHIAGVWHRPDQAAANINPSDLSDTIGDYGQGTSADIDAAVAAARAALPAWSHSVPLERAAILHRTAAGILARKEELARLLSREEGKPLADAAGEVMRAAQLFDFYAAEAVRLGGEIIPSLRHGVTVEITREPIGVIGVVTPWNFPIAIPAWKIAPALAYGNCAVFKPAELVPATACALMDIIAQAGLPPGVLNLVMGEGRVVGQRLADHPDVAGISFTGSVPTGRLVAAAAIGGLAMKKLQLEMGGKNPLVVLDDANLENAVDCAIDGAFFGTGQRCTASSRLIVTEGIHDRFVAALQARLAALVVDHALNPGTQIGPVASRAQYEQDLAYIALGQQEGARLASGGAPLVRAYEGFYLAPALFVDATPDMRICRDEIFGPVAAVIQVRDYEAALAVSNDTQFGLCAAICTTSLKHGTHYKRHSDAGMVKVNLSTAGVDFHVPFGGRKSSSYGAREQGSYAREFFTQVKTAYQLPL